jgi:predicted DNA-binding transcriptional regulator YafY
MKNLKILERLQQIHNLIATENTGTPNELANLMQISERSVHSLLGQLKDYNADISYSRSRKTYYYCEDFDLQVSISVAVLTNNEVTQIFGGSYFLQRNLHIAS